MKITALDRQCLLDISLQACGGVEAVFTLAARNGLSIIDTLQSEQEVEYEQSDVLDRRLVVSYANHGVRPALALPDGLLAGLVGLPAADDPFEEIKKEEDEPNPIQFTNIFSDVFEIQFA